MAIYHYRREGPWYTSLWAFLVLLLIVALMSVWYARRQQEMLVQRPERTEEIARAPGPPPQGYPRPPEP